MRLFNLYVKTATKLQLCAKLTFVMMWQIAHTAQILWRCTDNKTTDKIKLKRKLDGPTICDICFYGFACTRELDGPNSCRLFIQAGDFPEDLTKKLRSPESFTFTRSRLDALGDEFTEFVEKKLKDYQKEFGKL